MAISFDAYRFRIFSELRTRIRGESSGALSFCLRAGRLRTGRWPCLEFYFTLKQGKCGKYEEPFILISINESLPKSAPTELFDKVR